MPSKAIVHKANTHVEPCGPNHLVDEFEEEEESQTLINLSKADGEEHQLEEKLPSFDIGEESQTWFNLSKADDGQEPPVEETLPSFDIGEDDGDTTPSLADASASIKRQIQTECKEAAVVLSTQAIPPQPLVTPINSDPGKAKLEEAAVVPSTQAVPHQPLVTPVKSDSSKSCLVSTPPHHQVSITSMLTTSNLPKDAHLQQSPTPPTTKTPSRVSKSIVIMDSDGDWTVGGKETPLFKSKAGTTRKLKKPIQFKKLKRSYSPECLLSTTHQCQSTLFSQSPATPTQHPNVSKCDIAPTISGCGQTQPSPVLSTSPLADYSPATSSPPTIGFSTPESEVKKVKKDNNNISPPSKNDLHGQPLPTEVPHR